MKGLLWCIVSKLRYLCHTIFDTTCFFNIVIPSMHYSFPIGMCYSIFKAQPEDASFAFFFFNITQHYCILQNLRKILYCTLVAKIDDPRGYNVYRVMWPFWKIIWWCMCMWIHWLEEFEHIYTKIHIHMLCWFCDKLKMECFM